MSHSFITDTSLEGERLAAVGDLIALEYYEQIYATIAQELGEDIANTLAEPETMDGITYSWLSAGSGDVIRSIDLAENERSKLFTLARSHLAALRKLGQSMMDKSASSERNLGAILVKISNIPESLWQDHLFSIGGQPVFVHWGLEHDIEYNPQGSTEFHRVTSQKQVPVSQTLRFNPLLWFLWLLFILLCIIIFVKLVDGCGLFSPSYGFNRYCSAPTTPQLEEINRLKAEGQELENSILMLGSQITNIPICGTSSPPHIAMQGREKVVPLPVTSLPKPPTQDGSASKNASRYHQAINDLVRGAGAPKCDGVEIVALWEAQADIDLFVYCPVEGLTGDNIPDDRVIGPHNLNACGGNYDMESDGLGDSGPFFERICLTEQAEVGEYLVTVGHDTDDATQQSIAVRVVSRLNTDVHEEILNSKPGEESEDSMLITIEP